MLTTALTMMIDKAECFFFLKTPNSNSIQINNTITQTESPWIYSEIAISRVIQKRKPQRSITFGLGDEIQEKQGLPISYDVDLNHLVKLSATNLNTWENNKNSKEYSLDVLYGLYPPPTNRK